MRPPTLLCTHGGLFYVEFSTREATIAFYDTVGNHICIVPHLGPRVMLVLACMKRIYDKEPDGIAAFEQNERQLRVSVGSEETWRLLEAFGIAVGTVKGTGSEAGQMNGVVGNNISLWVSLSGLTEDQEKCHTQCKLGMGGRYLLHV